MLYEDKEVYHKEAIMMTQTSVAEGSSEAQTQVPLLPHVPPLEHKLCAWFGNNMTSLFSNSWYRQVSRCGTTFGRLNQGVRGLATPMNQIWLYFAANVHSMCYRTSDHTKGQRWVPPGNYAIHGLLLALYGLDKLMSAYAFTVASKAVWA